MGQLQEFGKQLGSECGSPQGCSNSVAKKREETGIALVKGERDLE